MISIFMTVVMHQTAGMRARKIINLFSNPVIKGHILQTRVVVR